MAKQLDKQHFFLTEIPIRIQAEGGKVNKDLLLADWMAAMNASYRAGKEILAMLERAEKINPNVWK